VVASDRSLGGFAREWGDDLPKVRKKRRMLDAEGVRFEEGGRRAKIRRDCFVGAATTPTAAAAPPRVDAGAGAKRRTTEETAAAAATERTPAQPSATAKRTSQHIVTDDEETLKRETLDLLRKRRPKSC